MWVVCRINCTGKPPLTNNNTILAHCFAVASPGERHALKIKNTINENGQ